MKKGCILVPKQKTKVFQDIGFDFDQSLIEAYSDLIAEINPDNFLNLESEFADQSSIKDKIDLSNSNGVFFVEELEKEIVN